MMLGVEDLLLGGSVIWNVPHCKRRAVHPPQPSMAGGIQSWPWRCSEAAFEAVIEAVMLALGSHELERPHDLTMW